MNRSLALVLLALATSTCARRAAPPASPLPPPTPAPASNGGASRAPPGATGGACTQDSDCALDDNCRCGPCVVGAPHACSETCAVSPCAGAAASCDPTSHRCVIVWTGLVGARETDPTDVVRVCVDEGGTLRALDARPRWAGVYDPSMRPRPELLNWHTELGCVTWPGSAPRHVECPAGSRPPLPLVARTACQQ